MNCTVKHLWSFGRNTKKAQIITEFYNDNNEYQFSYINEVDYFDIPLEPYINISFIINNDSNLPLNGICRIMIRDIIGFDDTEYVNIVNYQLNNIYGENDVVGEDENDGHLIRIENKRRKKLDFTTNYVSTDKTSKISFVSNKKRIETIEININSIVFINRVERCKDKM
jgi:hypothetical protein